MIRILSSDIMHPSLLIGARCFHQRRGDTRVLVPKMYTVARTRDGSGADVYMLTRYVDASGRAMSGIVAWDTEREAVCTEVHHCLRKMEPQMLVAWEHEVKGGGSHGA